MNTIPTPKLITTIENNPDLLALLYPGKQVTADFLQRFDIFWLMELIENNPRYADYFCYLAEADKIFLIEKFGFDYIYSKIKTYAMLRPLISLLPRNLLIEKEINLLNLIEGLEHLHAIIILLIY